MGGYDEGLKGYLSLFQFHRRSGSGVAEFGALGDGWFIKLGILFYRRHMILELEGFRGTIELR